MTPTADYGAGSWWRNLLTWHRRRRWKRAEAEADKAFKTFGWDQPPNDGSRA